MRQKKKKKLICKAPSEDMMCDLEPDLPLLVSDHCLPGLNMIHHLSALLFWNTEEDRAGACPQLREGLFREGIKGWGAEC